MKTNTVIIKFIAIVALFIFIIENTQAQIVGINLDGSAPNTNAMLDIKSTGTQGRGLLIPRLTLAQRTVSSTSGGLLNASGQLHGGAAQGLIVYQTDGTQGFYYNTSTTATPSWQYLSAGTNGATGPTGATGAAGNNGATGPTGAGGVSSGWYGGTGNVGNGQYDIGDWYIRTSTGEIYEKTGSLTWTYRTNVMGATGPAGATGSTGPTGAVGAAGAVGATGASENWMSGATAPTGGQGAVGDWYFNTATNTISEKTASTTWTTRATITGATGANGATGATGASENWMSGATAPTGGQGAVGDWYFNTATNTISEKTASTTWTSRATITGATGATGANGATGATGVSENWMSGATAPTGGQGNVGDWYFNTATNTISEKTASTTWTSRATITGATGATGAQGVTGPTGPAGSGGSSGWALTGNSGTTPGTNFLGTTDNRSLIFKVNNTDAGYLGTSDYNAFLGHNITYTNATFGVGIGYMAKIFGSHANSIAIGASSFVQAGSGTDMMAIGSAANVSGSGSSSYSMAIGSAAQVQASYGIAFGRAANVSNQYGIAIGDGAQTQTNTGALAIGRSTYANGLNSVTIGTSSQAQGSASVSLGSNAWSTMANSISIGGGDASNKTEAAGTASISIGYKAYSANTNSISIGSGDAGNRTEAQGNYAISIGYRAYTSAQDAIAIGDYARAQATAAVAIGNNTYNGSANTVLIGSSSNTSIFLNGATNTSYALQVGTSSSNGNGAYLTKGGVWTNASDVNLKEAFSLVDGNDILSKLSSLNITKWKYKGTDEYHIGPMAQDFYNAFNVGVDDKRISTIDPSGVALVAIKALNEKLELQQKLIDELTKKLAEVQTDKK